jgi:membrane protein involved in D-alanine export
VTPYADFTYFGVLVYVAVPALALSLARRSMRGWLLLASAGMLALHCWTPRASAGAATFSTLWLAIGYAAWEYLLARGFLAMRRHGRRQWAFYLAVALALAPLLAAKAAPLARPAWALGFLGVSYVTFRSLDVVIGIHDGLIAALPPARYLAFVFMFPTVSSGPVDRYRRFGQDWERSRTREEALADLDAAVHRLFRGFLYAFIVAVLVKRYWLDPAAAAHGAWATVSYMYAYSAYLFFDFAGYSAFAIAFSLLFGVHTPENFDRPFLAANIKEFWGRWHISLSAWFRDHVFMRFMLATARSGVLRSRVAASYLGYVLLFGLMGLWHGTALHFVGYGLYHAALFILHDRVARGTRGRAWSASPLWHAAGVLVTFNLVCFGFLIFSGRLG